MEVGYSLVSGILQQLASIAATEARQRVRLVLDVEDELRSIQNNLELIHCVLEDAEEKQMGDPLIKSWLAELKDAAYDIDDVLDEWNTELLKLQIPNGRVGNTASPKGKVCSCIPWFTPGQVVRRLSIGSKIMEIKGRLQKIAEQKNNYHLTSRGPRQQPRRNETSSFDIDVSRIHGRDQVMGDILNSLLCEDIEEGNELKTVSIVGMGGIGKTAIAQSVYNVADVKKHFKHRIWVCVSDFFDEIRIAKAIIRGLEDKEKSTWLHNYFDDSLTMQQLLERICVSITGEKFFLVLDDVWEDNRDKWERLIQTLRLGAPGSRILLTTRNKRVAQMMGNPNPTSLEVLPDKHCWSILRQLAFAGRDKKECESLNEVGLKISERCKGLPLAAKTLGSLLQPKTRRQWDQILNSALWQLDLAQKDIFVPLLLSYYDLPPPVRQCFLYCAIFPQDFEMLVHHLIEHWMAQGYLGLDGDSYLEETGREYFDLLASRCFFQDFRVGHNGVTYGCKMHDLVHDFALFLASHEFLKQDVTPETTSVKGSTSSKARYWTVTIAKGCCFPTSIYGAEKLRSLLTISQERAISSEAMRFIFNQAQRLRLVDFSWDRDWNHLDRTIPKEIGKLIHLRHLNLSGSKSIKDLPESVCELVNLQSMDLTGCSSLQKLPEGIGNLINLRKIRTVHCHDLSYYPKGFASLTSLREAIDIVVRIDRNDPNQFSLGDLEKLDNLHYLYITAEGDVIKTEEVNRAKLQSKIELKSFSVYPTSWHLDKDELVQALKLPLGCEVMPPRVDPDWGTTYPWRV
ncbi:hypothetical protein SLA2020_084630 [Shorea laevis]